MEYFNCINCSREVSLTAIGTQNRNHCPYCLWSIHLDNQIPGDRKSLCHGKMRPVALAYKAEGDKKIGEICLVHLCQTCDAISKNRIAGDDDPEAVIDIFKNTKPIEGSGIEVLAEEQADEIISQLFGKPNLAKYKGIYFPQVS